MYVIFVLCSEYSSSEMIVLHNFYIWFTQRTKKGDIYIVWWFLGWFLAHSHPLTIITVILFSINHSLIHIRLEAIVKDKKVYLKNHSKWTFTMPKPLSSRIFFLKIMCTLWQNCHFIPGQKIWRTLYTAFPSVLCGVRGIPRINFDAYYQEAAALVPMSP